MNSDVGINATKNQLDSDSGWRAIALSVVKWEKKFYRASSMSHSNEEGNPLAADSTRWILATLTEKLEYTRKSSEQWQESNGRAIAALANKVQEDQKTELELIQANTQAISDLIGTLDKLQTGQMSITQVIYEKQAILREFRDMIGAILKRNERYQKETCSQIETLARELATLQKNFWKMQQEVFDILKELAAESRDRAKE